MKSEGDKITSPRRQDLCYLNRPTVFKHIYKRETRSEK